MTYMHQHHGNNRTTSELVTKTKKIKFKIQNAHLFAKILVKNQKFTQSSVDSTRAPYCMYSSVA